MHGVQVNEHLQSHIEAAQQHAAAVQDSLSQSRIQACSAAQSNEGDAATAVISIDEIVTKCAEAQKQDQDQHSHAARGEAEDTEAAVEAAEESDEYFTDASNEGSENERSDEGTESEDEDCDGDVDTAVGGQDVGAVAKTDLNGEGVQKMGDGPCIKRQKVVPVVEGCAEPSLE